MIDYYDTDDRPMNDETYERMENRPMFLLREALEFDRELFNRILNKPFLTGADKYNLASMFAQCSYEYAESTQTSKSFEDFLIEVNGKEWFDNMMRGYLQRQNREFAKKLNCPELANNKGIYLYSPGD